MFAPFSICRVKKGGFNIVSLYNYFVTTRSSLPPGACSSQHLKKLTAAAFEHVISEVKVFFFSLEKPTAFCCQNDIHQELNICHLVFHCDEIRPCLFCPRIVLPLCLLRQTRQQKLCGKMIAPRHCDRVIESLILSGDYCRSPNRRERKLPPRLHRCCPILACLMLLLTNTEEAGSRCTRNIVSENRHARR